MKLLNSEKLRVFPLIWVGGGGVPGIPGASSVIQAALTSHPIMLVLDTGGRYREERHCVIYLPATAMRYVPSAGEQNNNRAFGILEKALSVEAWDE